MVCDGGTRRNHLRNAGLLTTPYGMEDCYQHLRLSMGGGRSQGQIDFMTEDERNDRSAEEQETQPHPFLCSWLPGMHIYAAAAAGQIWINDGARDIQLMHVASIVEYGMQNPPSYDFEESRGWGFGRDWAESGCRVLAWSPDRSSLVWVWGSKVCIMSFKLDLHAPAIADLWPLMQPVSYHRYVNRFVPRRNPGH
ncbi:hypothetical protein WJX84_010854 [Apatococcus fuscideae]|uniref:Uncharacterized protein n=1 Tax=Apatococcus fuscideae TaxID=2026836 RepID=A0AAW1T111_9CHLO